MSCPLRRARSRLSALMVSLLPAACLTAGELKLAWVAPSANADGSALHNLAGYRVYYAPAGQPLGSPRTVGLTTTTTLSGLADGAQYDVSVTAVNSLGTESPFSVTRRLTAASSPTSPPDATNRILRVATGAAGAGDGSSWDDAYPELAPALAAATEGTEVWVAEGTYVPGTGRNATFTLKNGVDVYGGFRRGMASRSERDWSNAVTVLSGEIGSPAIEDNVCHVLTGGAGRYVLDGFTITRGYAWNSKNDSPANRSGGGLLVWDADATPVIQNCAFVDNAANQRGGALCLQYRTDGSEGALLTNCVFRANRTWRAASYGGAVYQSGRRPVHIVNATFTANSSRSGGALYSQNGDPRLTGVTFERNSASHGGALFAERSSLASLQPLLLDGCSFTDNTTVAGGIAWISRAGAAGDLVRATRFAGNRSTGWGACGLYLKAFNGTVSASTFEGNSGGGAIAGGALTIESSSATVQRCVVTGNTNSLRGGGLYTHNQAGRTLLVENSLIAGNTTRYDGGGVCLFGTAGKQVAEFVHCTIADNQTTRGGKNGGGGIQLRFGTALLLNSIVWGNSAASGNGASLHANAGPCLFDVRSSDIGGGQAGIYLHRPKQTLLTSGMISGDPLFTALPASGLPSAAGSYALATISPCRDSGVDAGVMDDLAGLPRPAGSGYDMGASEAPAATPAAPVASMLMAATAASLTATGATGPEEATTLSSAAPTAPTKDAAVNSNGARIAGLARARQGRGFELRWRGEPGRRYRVERTTDLAAGFEPIARNLAAAGEGNVFVDAEEPPEGRAFYRIVAEP